MKVFAEGTQVFSFRAAAWRLLDLGAKYAMWSKAVGNPALAHRLFQVALDLADARVGALFVVLRHAKSAMSELLTPTDIIMDNPARPATPGVTRRDFAYLLSSRSVVSMDQSVLEGMASMDGATVCDREGRLVAVGAILRHPAAAPAGSTATAPTEGARTTAALAASRFGPVMKVSEDGAITCFDKVKLWET
jgi:DNA integrity scanning protein DisA with diadenylate cyclase activity